MTLAIGLIGFGWMGAQHARVVDESRATRLVAIADVSADRRAAAGQRHPGAHLYATSDELLTDTSVDAVMICTPDHLHRGVTEAALESGRPVFLEKPIATTLDDARAIVDCAARTQSPLLVGHILRFNTHYTQAVEKIGSGAIGEIVHVGALRHDVLYHGRRIGGRTSVLFYLGIHEADVLRWVTGSDVTRVHAESCRRVLTDLDVDDAIVATLRFSSGAVASLQHSWILPDSLGTDGIGGLDVVGTRGRILVEEYNDQAARFWDGSGSGFLDPGVAAGRVVGMLRGELDHFVDCALGEATPAVTPVDALRAVEIVLALQQSLATGDAVTLPMLAPVP